MYGLEYDGIQKMFTILKRTLGNVVMIYETINAQV